MWPFNNKQEPQDEALLAEYNTVLKMMVKPSLTDMGNGMFLHRVCRELFHHENNRMGIILGWTWNAYLVFHTITKNNQFLKAGPVLCKHGVGIHAFDPPVFGIFDLVTSRTGLVRRGENAAPRTTLGFEVVEIDTDYRPFIEFSEWIKNPRKESLSFQSHQSPCQPLVSPRQRKLEDSPQIVAEAALRDLDPIYLQVFQAYQRIPTPTSQELAKEFSLPERAIIHIIGTARTRVQNHMHGL